MINPAKPRRKFVACSLATTSALGFPMIATAQPIVWRLQSTWSSKDIFHEYAQDFVQRVNQMTGGKLKMNLVPAGSIVKAFDLLDAVSKGSLDGGHGVVAYWYGKNPALALWGSGPAFGMNANMVLAWHEFGGGAKLLDEIYRGLNVNVKSFLYGPMATQPLGWFKKPVLAPSDLKGLKYRTVGLSIDVFTALGASVNALPGAEIVPALQRGLIDAAEFNNATSDRLLGFPDVAKVCMLQSFHQASEQFEILFNRPKFDSLPGEIKSIIEYAVQSASAHMSWKAIDRYSKDYQELKASESVKFYKTSDSILRAQLEAWDTVCDRKSAQSVMFKRVYDSMKTYAHRATNWENDTQVDYQMAANHYFGAKKP
jgi:TRAP-type mannitol/chloroaromatic compound transport system substrate-binding protein